MRLEDLGTDPYVPYYYNNSPGSAGYRSAVNWIRSLPEYQPGGSEYRPKSKKDEKNSGGREAPSPGNIGGPAGW